MRRKVRWWLVALLVLVPAVGLTSLWRAMQVQQDTVRRLQCNGNCCAIALGLHNYHDAQGHLPPAYVPGPDGRPWHSWRVLVYRQIETHGVLRDYRLDEPWDGPNNRRLLDLPTPNTFACPADPEGRARGRTNYFVVVGPGTAFPGPKPMTFAAITRPHEKTVLVVEAAGRDIHWMEPRDLLFEELTFAPGENGPADLSSGHRSPTVVFADGSREGAGHLNPLDLRAMLLTRP